MLSRGRVHTCIHACMHACQCSLVEGWVHTCMHAYIHQGECMHIHMHPYIHTSPQDPHPCIPMSASHIHMYIYAQVGRPTYGRRTKTSRSTMRPSPFHGLTDPRSPSALTLGAHGPSLESTWRPIRQSVAPSDSMGRYIYMLHTCIPMTCTYTHRWHRAARWDVWRARAAHAPQACSHAPSSSRRDGVRARQRRRLRVRGTGYRAGVRAWQRRRLRMHRLDCAIPGPCTRLDCADSDAAGAEASTRHGKGAAALPCARRSRRARCEGRG